MNGSIANHREPRRHLVVKAAAGTARTTALVRRIGRLLVSGVAGIVHPVREHLMGWSPDGTRLLFTSDRTGSMALWSLGFTNARPDTYPRLLRDNVNGFARPDADGARCTSTRTSVIAT